MSHLILVVEDEPDISALLKLSLEREGMGVETVASARAALDRMVLDPLPDLLLLDLMLPDQPGTEICRQVRQLERTRDIPVVIISARSEEIDRVVGFELGADDFVPKPFSAREVTLRVRAILRRRTRGTEGAGTLTAGQLRLDLEEGRAWVNREEVQLTRLELSLLQAFVGNAGKALTRQEILEQVWGEPVPMDHRAVDAHIKRLRRKLGPVGECFETVRGYGYRFRVPEAA